MAVHRTQQQVETLTPDHNNWCHKTGIFSIFVAHAVRGLDRWWTGLEP